MALLAVGCLLACWGTASAQDWPQWRGANRDGAVTGFTAPQQWPQALKQQWQVNVGAGDATPALVGDKLYVFSREGDEEVLRCLNAGDGKEVWKYAYTAQAVTGAASRHPGPRSSPAVAEGKVVALGVGGVLSCVDAGSGKLVWQKDPFPKVVPRFFTSYSPLIVDGRAVAHLGGDGNGALIAYDLASGDETWRWAEEGPSYSSPVLLTAGGTKQIVALSEKSVVGVEAADGKLLWKLPFEPQRRAYNAATPIVTGDTVIYTGASRGATAVKIEKAGGGFAAKELWSNTDASISPQFASPVLCGDLLFGLSARGNLYCLDAKSGKTTWTDSARHGRGFCSMVNTGSAVLALPSTGELIVFKPVGDAYTELAKIKVSDTATYAHPVVAGNRVFIKNQEALTLYTLG